MTPHRVLLDSNLYIDWFNHGAHEPLVLGQGLTRFLSAVVVMELRAGTTTLRAQRALDQLVRPFRVNARLVTPSVGVFDEAGRVLQRLRGERHEVRRASLVNDVLIALSARAIGATLYTRDADYRSIRDAVDFGLELVRVSAPG